jgi:tRNA threonylcarbamoyladenosine biosynthesis protein TsaE
VGHFTIATPGPEATERVGRALALELEPGDCVLLQGDLGAGKTCLVRGMAAGLGCDPAAVHSPTFTIMARHHGSLCDLVHVDAYRISCGEELRDAGVDPADASAVLAIEWPDRVRDVWPTRHLEVRITPIDESIREITVTDHLGTLAERLAAAVGPRPCPSCQRPVGAFESDWPFCGARCRAADLGRWFGGHYQITRPLDERDLEEGLG